MDSQAPPINEQLAAAAFSRQSAIFDSINAGNSIIQYKRKRVRDHVQSLLDPESRILELNCGTGEDAIWFSKLGHYVHATDISTGMMGILKEKISLINPGTISTELCSFTALETLSERGPYDLIFSNFAGLNCTGDLKKVLHSFQGLLKPGGKIVLVILPSFCLWESLLLFKGKWKTAFRRLFSKRGFPSKVEGVYFRCWYYNPSYIIREMKDSYTVLGLEGLCTLVPPSYIEHFAEQHSAIYRYLKSKEDLLKSVWPWKSIGDYYIISLQKKPAVSPATSSIEK
jgi:ubiquinone/menaquinone biosynthesis C-methylase UbiE